MLERPFEFNGLRMHRTRDRDWGLHANYGKVADPGDPADPATLGVLSNGPAPAAPSTVWDGTPGAEFSWWVQIRSITGLWDSDVVDERFPVPGRSGERSGDDFYSGKPITIAATVHGKHLTGLRIGQRAVRAAFADLETHALYMRSWIDSNRLYVNCRKVQPLDMPEEQVSERYDRNFTVGLRADDPRLYSVVERSQELLAPSTGTASAVRRRDYTADVASVSGFVRHLRDYPIPGLPRRREYNIAATGGSSSLVVSGGSVDTYPVTDLFGPMTNPIYRNLTTGLQLRWPNLTLEAGHFLRIDHDTGSVMLDGITPYATGLDVVNSDFWNLVSGDNLLSLIPYSSGIGARAVIYWRDAH